MRVLRVAIPAIFLTAGTALSGHVLAVQNPSGPEASPSGCPAGTQLRETGTQGRLVAEWCARPDGTKQGPHVTYYPNGRKVADRGFADGVVDGPATYYLNDGTVHLRQEWRQGHVVFEWRNPLMDTLSRERLQQLGSAERDGVRGVACGPGDRRPECRSRPRLPSPRTVRFPDGRRQAAGRLVDGERFGVWRFWHPNGRLARKAAYHSGELAGEYREWHANGQPRTQGEYLSGRKSKRWRHWDEAGRRLPDEQFPDLPTAVDSR